MHLYLSSNGSICRETCPNGMLNVYVVGAKSPGGEAFDAFVFAIKSLYVYTTFGGTIRDQCVLGLELVHSQKKSPLLGIYVNHIRQRSRQAVRISTPHLLFSPRSICRSSDIAGHQLHWNSDGEQDEGPMRPEPLGNGHHGRRYFSP